MRRREYVAVCGGAFGGLAGCLSDGGSESTPTTTPVDTSTPTETPEPKPPEIKVVNLVTSWETFGDVVDNRVEASTPGAPITIGYRFDLESHDGEAHSLEQVEIRDENGDRVAIDQRDDRQLTDDSGYSTWEGGMTFDTSGWERGEYTAEVKIRDEVAGKTSESSSTEFELTEPLSESEVSFVDVECPARVDTGEPFTYEFSIRNTGNRDGAFRTNISIKDRYSDWYSNDEFWYLTIASGDVGSAESGEITFDEAGEYTYRIDAIGETWTIRVED